MDIRDTKVRDKAEDIKFLPWKTPKSYGFLSIVCQIGSIGVYFCIFIIFKGFIQVFFYM